MMYNTYLSFEYDDFIIDTDRAIWIACLSDGRRVYQDDDRPNYEPNAWHRLKNYCEENRINIDNLFLRFRSNIIEIGPADGYFFIKALLGQWGSAKTFYFYKIGKLKNNKLIVEKWRVPHLTKESEEERLLEEEVVKKCLIRNV